MPRSVASAPAMPLFTSSPKLASDLALISVRPATEPPGMVTSQSRCLLDGDHLIAARPKQVRTKSPVLGVLWPTISYTAAALVFEDGNRASYQTRPQPSMSNLR